MQRNLAFVPGSASSTALTAEVESSLLGSLAYGSGLLCQLVNEEPVRFPAPAGLFRSGLALPTFLAQRCNDGMTPSQQAGSVWPRARTSPRSPLVLPRKLAPLFSCSLCTLTL